MITIKKIRKADKAILKDISELHIKAFPDFFLTKLGKRFVGLLYKCYIEDKKSEVAIAQDGKDLIGFVAYSYDYPMFYKNLVKKHIVKFALCSLLATVKHPSFIKRLFGAFRKSNEVQKEEKYVEIASICVNPEKSGKGTGTLLIDYVKNNVDFRIYEYINLETDAKDNDRVNKFYIKNGFKLHRTYTTKEGRRMNEYRYYGAKK